MTFAHENPIVRIYQTCRTTEAIQLAFDFLQKELEPEIEQGIDLTRKKLLENFDEEVHEMTLKADTYDMTITLLLFSNDKSSKWDEVLEETEPIDIFERITANHN